MAEPRYSINWAPDLKSAHPILRLKGPWHPKIPEIMRKLGVMHLELDRSIGWKGTTLDFLQELADLEGLMVYLPRETLDVSPISAMRNLWALELRCDGFAGRLDLSGLPLLRELAIKTWNPKVFAGLSGSLRLRFLRLGEDQRPGFNGRDFGELSRMEHLQFLMLIRPRIQDLAGAEGLERLETIHLYDPNRLESLKGLEGCGRLKTLTIMGAPRLVSLDALAGHPSLRELQLVYCPKLQSLRPLDGLQRLERIDLGFRTKVADGDLSALTRLPRLRYADFEDRKHYSHKSADFPKRASRPLVAPKLPPLPGQPPPRKPSAPMPPDRFWKIIEGSAREAKGRCSAQCAALRKRLLALSAKEIEAFQSRFEKEMDRAYTWDLWGAAYVIAGGCSDDGFSDFRSWLISRGRKAFEAALKRPDSLAALVRPQDRDCQFESFQYVAQRALERKEGSEKSGLAPDSKDRPTEPKGKPWKESSDELQQRFPKLWERFGK